METNLRASDKAIRVLVLIIIIIIIQTRDIDTSVKTVSTAASWRPYKLIEIRVFLGAAVNSTCCSLSAI